MRRAPSTPVTAELVGATAPRGINLYPAEHGTPGFLEFDSMINLRPGQGNRTRSVEDPAIRVAIAALVGHVVTKTQVDAAGNAIIDFQFTCRVAMSVDFGVQVQQYPRKGAAAYGGAGNVFAYVCIPGTPLAPVDGDQFVENGALFIQPGTGDLAEGRPASGRFVPGHATVGVNIFWTSCDGATTMEECWSIIAAADDPDTEDVETPMGDAFWKYQTVKLTRSR